MKETNNTKQAFWVSLGSLFAFGFAIVSSMILARYFPKEDYGTYKQVLYVYSTLLFVFTLGLPMAFSYYLPRVPIEQAKSLIKKITNLFFILGSAFSILLFVFSSLIASFLKNPDLSLALKVFSPVPLLMLPTMGLEGILSTYRRTQFLAVYTILSKVFMLLCVALPVVFFNGGYIQAIIGFTVASFINFLIAFYLKYLPVKDARNETCSVTYKDIFKFSLPLMYASFWGTIISSADQFFISRYFGTSVFADFSNGSLELPLVGMVVGAGATILGPLFSKQIHVSADVKTEILPLWTSVFEKTAKIIYPLVLFFWFFADIVMVALYGAQYENSGNYFRIKLIVNLFTMISYAPLILATGATSFYAKVHMYGAIVLVSLEYSSILLFNSPYIVTMVSVVCQIGRILALLIFLAHYFKINLFELFPLKLIVKILLPSILLLTLTRYAIVDIFQIRNILVLVVGFIAYSIFYFIWSYFAKIDNLSIIKPLFLKLKI